MTLQELENQTEQARVERVKWERINDRKIEEMNRLARECNFMALKINEELRELTE